MPTLHRFVRLALTALLPLAAATRTEAQGTARVPFGDGERSEYEVKLGRVGAGRAIIEIAGTGTFDGHPVWHARMHISGGVPLARVEDRFESWIDMRGVFSRRFRQDQKEVRFRRQRTYELFPERDLWRRADNGDRGALTHTDRPQDDVSFLYFVRTVPLEVGRTYSFNNYFKERGNPVQLQVLRRETVRVPAGTFRTLVVRPIIKTDGLFGEGGQAEVYVTDDDRRLLVQIRSRVPVVGSLTMSLRSYRAAR